MAWGYGTTVADTEAYEGPQGFAEEVTETPVVEEETPIDMETFLNSLKVSDKFSFYLDDSVGQFGVKYRDSPFSAHLNIGQGGQTNWGAQVGTGTGLLNANVGIAGQGTSGQISPWGNLSSSPMEGLTFSVGAQKNPGMNFNMTGPSVSYGNEWGTPWGQLNLNVGKSYGQDPYGKLTLSKDW